MVRLANVVGVVDVVVFVEAGLLETSLPELGGLVVVRGGVESVSCAEERVGEKEGRRERWKRKSVYKRFMALEKRGMLDPSTVCGVISPGPERLRRPSLAAPSLIVKCNVGVHRVLHVRVCSMKSSVVVVVFLHLIEDLLSLKSPHTSQSSHSSPFPPSMIG